MPPCLFRDPLPPCRTMSAKEGFFRAMEEHCLMGGRLHDLAVVICGQGVPAQKVIDLKKRAMKALQAADEWNTLKLIAWQQQLPQTEPLFLKKEKQAILRKALILGEYPISERQSRHNLMRGVLGKVLKVLWLDGGKRYGCQVRPDGLRYHFPNEDLKNLIRMLVYPDNKLGEEISNINRLEEHAQRKARLLETIRGLYHHESTREITLNVDVLYCVLCRTVEEYIG